MHLIYYNEYYCLLYRKGHHFIYQVLDWSKPNVAFTVAVGAVVLAVFIHVFLFLNYKLRLLFYRRWVDNDIEQNVPISQSQSTVKTGSTISMVFEGAGNVNPAYQSTDNIK